MLTIYRALSAGSALALLTACASPTATHKPISAGGLAAIQPMDVQIAIPQTMLYARYSRASIASSTTFACGLGGAIPGVGILAAVACGAAAGAADAAVNGPRALAAQSRAKPLNDAMLDLDVDDLVQASLSESVARVPGVQIREIHIDKASKPFANQETQVAEAKANSVMFVLADYRLSEDISTFELELSTIVYPRGAASAIELPGPVPSGTPGMSKFGPDYATYQSKLTYVARLPNADADGGKNSQLWGKDGAALLRAALLSGVRQAAQVLARDMQSQVSTSSTANPVAIDNAMLHRLDDGSMVLQADMNALMQAKANATRDAQARSAAPAAEVN